MALPIKETPVLIGKDAKNFVEEMKSTQDKKISAEEQLRIKDNYEKMMKASKQYSTFADD